MSSFPFLLTPPGYHLLGGILPVPSPGKGGGLVVGLATLHRKKPTATETITTQIQKGLSQGGSSSPEELMMQNSESPREAILQTNLITTKAKTRIGTWNIRTLYEASRSAQVAKEMRRYDIKVLGLCETRWNGSGQTRLDTGETIIFSGHEDPNHDHSQGVALMLSPEATKALISWEPISPRLISARFKAKGRKTTIIQCYAPTNAAKEEEKENFYGSLQTLIDHTQKRDMIIVMGDMNAKVGADNTDRELIMGRNGVGSMNENGELLADLCAFNDLVIGGTVFPHKTIHKTTWTSPDGNTENQIDHITVSRKWRRSLLDVKVRRGADVASDHQLLVGTVKTKLKAFKDLADKPHHKFNTQYLKNGNIKEVFNCTVKNRYDTLSGLIEETVDQHWGKIQEIWNTTCTEILGKKKREQKAWITADTWSRIEARKELKQKINQCQGEQEKGYLRTQYWETNRIVKRSAREDKRRFIHEMTEEAETAAGQGNMKRLYDITRTLSGKNSNSNKPVRDNDGKIITSDVGQRDRWAQHFKDVLNRPPPSSPPDIPLEIDTLDVNTGPPTKAEITKAIKSIKNGKAAGPDGIPPEALKADPTVSAEMLQPLLQKIWEEELVPNDWKLGYMVKLPKKGDLSKCSNWRGIMLLSVPGKVLARIILERLKEALDERLRPEQAGFRQGRSCIDHIATLRIIIEQSLEWQSPLYMTFVDFEKAFDSVDRETIWKLMSHYGIPHKFISITKKLYENCSCQVIHKGKLTSPFAVNTGVRQGCMLSPMIFLIVIDWIMRKTTSGNNTGIQWTFSKKLEDLDFADDVALLSHRLQHAQSKLNRLSEEARKVGLKINKGKTEVMRVNSEQDTPIQLDEEVLMDANSFIYLGSIVGKDGGTDDDIKSRINKARLAFNSLRPVWNSRALSLKNKIRIFNTNVKSVLLYGSETWKVAKTTTNKLQTFVNRCLRRILKIRWPETVTNENLWERTNQRQIDRDIKGRKWKWIGHTLRRPESSVTRQALDWNPQGKRKVGRPRQTWRRSVESEAKTVGLT